MNEYEDFERRQQRTRLLVGDGKLERLRRAHVLVLGVGVALDENGYVYLTQIFCR